MTDNAATLPDDDDISLLDLLQAVVDNLRLLVFGPLLAGLVALGIAFLIPPTYTAKVQFIPPKQQQSSAAAALSDLGVLGGAAGAIAGVKNPADQYAALARSRSVADALVEQFNLVKRYDKEFKEDALKSLANFTKVAVGAKDGLITIEFEDKDPTVAARICNAYVDELRKLLNRVALTEAQQRRVFFEKQVQDAKAGLVEAEQALKASGVDSSALKVTSTVALEGVARLKAQIAVQEVKLAAMRGYLAESAPDFLQGLRELAALRQQMIRADKDEGVVIGKSDYVAKFREFRYHETLLALYLRQFELARVDESREGAVIQVIDAAEPPERRSSPKRALLASIAAVGSGIMLLLYVFVRHTIAKTRDNPTLSVKLDKLGLTLKGKCWRW